jgi:hypothetical protein
MSDSDAAVSHLPNGEVRQATVGETLWLFIDADDPEHPLEKKAVIRGKPVEVEA